MPGNIFLCIGIEFWQQTVEDRALIHALKSILPGKFTDYYRNIITGNITNLRDSLIIIDTYSFRAIINDPAILRKFVQDILEYNKVLLLFDRDRERHYSGLLERDISLIDTHPNFYRLTDSSSRVSDNVLYCENFFQGIIDIENLHVLDKSNIADSYFCLMNRSRTHRDWVVDLLYKKDLLWKGFVTYHEGNIDVAGLQHTQRFADLDGFNFGDKGWPDHNLNIYYNQHALELVTETVMEYSFVTEKTMKPLLAGTPFLLVAGSGQLAHLRNYGFKTCNDMWDESYDDIVDSYSRTVAVIDILEDLASKPGNFLTAHAAYQQHYDHNLAVLRDYQLTKDDLLKTQLRGIINKLC